jgi:hypothetical protein
MASSPINRKNRQPPPVGGLGQLGTAASVTTQADEAATELVEWIILLKAILPPPNAQLSV